MEPFNFKKALLIATVGSILIHGIILVMTALTVGLSLTECFSFLIGVSLGVLLCWSVYGLALFCMWLRRKQVEGDRQ